MPMTNGQIVAAVREATTAALVEVLAMGLDPNAGTSNFDRAMLRLAHPRPTLAAALRAGGFPTEWTTYRLQGRGYPVVGADIPALGAAGQWTAYVEAIVRRLEAAGVPAFVRYRMD